MQITINIPKEFENHFNSDKFEDSLQRVRFDIHKAIIAKKDILSGNYEIETLDMLTEAFLKGTPLPKGHGDLKDADVMKNKLCTHEASNCKNITNGMYYASMTPFIPSPKGNGFSG